MDLTFNNLITTCPNEPINQKKEKEPKPMALEKETLPKQASEF